jgi:hypothetical protein
MHVISLIVCTRHAGGRSVRLKDSLLPLQAVKALRAPVPLTSHRSKGLTAPRQLTIGGHLLDDSSYCRSCKLRQCKYLNNVVEQDHRKCKTPDLAGEELRVSADSVADLAWH